MNWFITLWFSTMNAAIPITQWNVPMMAESLNSVHNIWTVADTTADVGSIAYYLPNFTEEMARVKLFKAREQTLLLDKNGNFIFLGTKFLAPDQWVILANTIDPSTPLAHVDIYPYYNPNERFDISTDSVKLVDWTLKKAKATGLAYVIYRGPEYDYKDRYDFSFKKK